ncbi:MAG: hypothetical protein HQL56_01790 [Magnetococcales bacterium]|nr:hypothetical protein [Magnetococcales bacterium]
MNLLELPNETLVYISIIVSMFVLFVFFFNSKTAARAPSILTTMGIFFTFLGIAKGLFYFDAKNIQSSVPALLDGLRTAFWASVFGVGSALLIKMRELIWGIPVHKGEIIRSQGATIDDLAVHLIALRQALIGTDDSTLITQLKLGRQESNDRLDSVKRVMEEFTRTMADNNSKALIEALEQVMRDFNTKINEQFGENFKKLNSAVGDILIWQERYRAQMGEMIVQQERNTKSLEQASLKFENLVSHAEQYTRTAQDLANLLQAIEIQRKSLEEGMTSLGQLFITASRSLPEIETRIVDFAAQIARSTQKANEDMAIAARSSMENMRTSVEKVINSSAAQLEKLEKALLEVENTVLKCVHQVKEGSTQANEMMGRSVQESAQAIKKSLAEGQDVMSEGIRATNEKFNSQVQEMINKSGQQVATLDLALEKELTKSLESLGKQLTALSQQFVRDYEPLVAALREITNAVRQS